MKKLIISAALLLLTSGASYATCTPPLAVLDGSSNPQNLSVGIDPGGNCLYNFGNSAAITNPTSTLTLPATTTAYAPGELIASSATAGSVVVPSFTIPNSAGGFYLPALILTSSDTAATAYVGTIVQIDLWRAAPTFTNGNLGAYAVATGAAGFLGSYSCTLVQAGDGAYSTCAPSVGTTAAIKVSSGTSVFWTAQAVSASGVLTVSKAFTLTAELSN